MFAPAASPDGYAQAIATRLLTRDPFGQWLGLELSEVRLGHCSLYFRVRPDMLNGFGALHGGVAFAAAESAFALACHTHGRQSVSLTATMDYLETGRLGDILLVDAREEILKEKVSTYLLRLTNQHGTLLALFKGTAYRTRHEL
ncbi:hotdog fold thioesterase [Hymenobacter bucti]|uniref:Hotdog fold thioesterase n=1 Tax=Hymenobacter bucti TaxID=1844114 RepID=A0ABW4QX07_9BACT